ncbi:MAG: glyoxalase [Clostridiales bacterium]|nr:glyoxalase [Clostridiales bacterium]
MEEYSEECLDTFLARQGQLFDEPVAGTREEAEAFLEDCLAQTAGSLDEVRRILDESGMDVSDLDDGKLEEQAEVFPLPDGTYLIVEG